ncbi:MAG: Ig-like domain-containing protein [archaeon]
MGWSEHKSLLALLPIFLLLLLLAPPAAAASLGNVSWGNDTKLTSNTALSEYPVIATDQYGNVHVAWQDYRDVYGRIYYKKLDNTGTNLTGDVRVSDIVNYNALGPSLALDSSGNAHITWYDKRNGASGWFYDIYYTKINGATNATIVNDIYLTNTHLVYMYQPNYIPKRGVALDSSGNVHVVWGGDKRNTGEYYEIYYKKLDNTGSTLVPDTRLTNNPANHYSFSPSLAVDAAGNVHVAWNKYPYPWRTYYKKLDNTGGSLTGDIGVSNSSSFHSYFPSIAVDAAGNVHVAWYDTRDSYSRIYYKKLNSAGTNLTGDVRVSDIVNYNALGPSLALDSSGNVHVAWHDARTGRNEIYYKKLNTTGGNLTGDVRLTTKTGSYASLYPALTVDASDNIHLTWQDNRDGNYEIYYKRGTQGPPPPPLEVPLFDAECPGGYLRRDIDQDLLCSNNATNCVSTNTGTGALFYQPSQEPPYLTNKPNGTTNVYYCYKGYWSNDPFNNKLTYAINPSPADISYWDSFTVPASVKGGDPGNEKIYLYNASLAVTEYGRDALLSKESSNIVDNWDLSTSASALDRGVFGGSDIIFVGGATYGQAYIAPYLYSGGALTPKANVLMDVYGASNIKLNDLKVADINGNKILVTGSRKLPNANASFFLASYGYNSAGEGTFTPAYTFYRDEGAGNDGGNAIAVYDFGGSKKILVAGYGSNLAGSGNTDAVLWDLATNGDTITFEDVKYINSGRDDEAYDVVVGNFSGTPVIFAVGTTDLTAFIQAYTYSGGSLVAKNYAFPDFSAGRDVFLAAAVMNIRGEDKIVVTGYSEPSPGASIYDLLIAAYSYNLTTDTITEDGRLTLDRGGTEIGKGIDSFTLGGMPMLAVTGGDVNVNTNQSDMVIRVFSYLHGSFTLKTMLQENLTSSDRDIGSDILASNDGVLKFFETGDISLFDGDIFKDKYAYRLHLYNYSIPHYAGTTIRIGNAILSDGKMLGDFGATRVYNLSLPLLDYVSSSGAACTMLYCDVPINVTKGMGYRVNFDTLAMGYNTPPVITSPSDYVLYDNACAGLPLVVPINTTDVDGDAITFSLVLVSPPAPVVTLSETGVLTFLAQPAQAGIYTIIVRATDEHGLSDPVLSQRTLTFMTGVCPGQSAGNYTCPNCTGGNSSGWGEGGVANNETIGYGCIKQICRWDYAGGDFCICMNDTDSCVHVNSTGMAQFYQETASVPPFPTITALWYDGYEPDDFVCHDGRWSADPLHNFDTYARDSFLAAGSHESARILVPKNALLTNATLDVRVVAWSTTGGENRVDLDIGSDGVVDYSVVKNNLNISSRQRLYVTQVLQNYLDNICAADPCTIPLNVTMQDAGYVEFDVNFIEYNRPPVIDAPIPNQTALVGVPFLLNLFAYDYEDSATFVMRTDQEGVVGPLSASWDFAGDRYYHSGLISFTPALGQKGEYVVWVTAEDNHLRNASSDTTTFNLNIVSETICSSDADCVSGICNYDWDGQKFCSDARDICVTNNDTASVINIFKVPSKSYPPFATNVADVDYGTQNYGYPYVCYNGWWSEDPFQSQLTFSDIGFASAGSDNTTAVLIPSGVQILGAMMGVVSNVTSASINFGADGTTEFTGIAENYTELNIAAALNAYLACAAAECTIPIDVQSSSGGNVILYALRAEYNHPPELLNVANLTAVVNQPFAYQVLASDPDGDALSFDDTSSLPAKYGVLSNGSYEWANTDLQDVGTYSVNITVVDQHGMRASAEFTLRITSDTVCAKDTDCLSGYCRNDWDGDKFCALNGTKCVSNNYHQQGELENFDSQGLFPADAVDADIAGYRCNIGHWSEDPLGHNSDTFDSHTFPSPGDYSGIAIKLPPYSSIINSPPPAIWTDSDVAGAITIGNYLPHTISAGYHEHAIGPDLADYLSQNCAPEAYCTIPVTVHANASGTIDVDNLKIRLNWPPYWDPYPPNLTTAEDTPIFFQINAEDLNVGDSISYSANNSQGFPDAVWYDNGTEWTPPADFYGPWRLTLYATDGYAPVPAYITIYVTPVNDCPVVANIPNVTILESSFSNSTTLDSYVTDPDNTMDQISWAYSGNVHLNVSIDPAAPRRVTLAPLTRWSDEWNPETITFTASDGACSSNQSIGVRVIPVNYMPTITDIPDVTFYEDSYNESILLDDYIDDPETPDALISWTASGGVYVTLGLTASRFAHISATPHWSGTETLTLTATDGQYNVSDSLAVTVLPVDDAPVLRPYGEQTAYIQRVFQSSVVALDPDVPPDVLTFTDNTSLFVINPSTGSISFTPTMEQMGSYPVEICVSDSTNLTDCLQTVFHIKSSILCDRDMDCESGYCRQDIDGEKYCAHNSTVCVVGNYTSVTFVGSQPLFTTDVSDGVGDPYRCINGYWSQDPFKSSSTSKTKASSITYDQLDPQWFFMERVLKEDAGTIIGPTDSHFVDFDDSNGVDVLFTDTLGGAVTLLRQEGINNRIANFSERTLFFGLANPFGLMAWSHEYDGDYDDLLFEEINSTTFRWFENTGDNQNFIEHVISDSLTSPVIPADTHIQQFGSTVRFVTFHQNGELVIWEGNHLANNTMVPRVLMSLEPDPAGLMRRNNIYRLDFNHAGSQDDYVVARQNNISWYENDGTDSFTEHPIAGSGIVDGVVYDMVVTDFNLDNKYDVVFATASKLAWLENDGDGTFTTHQIATQGHSMYGIPKNIVVQDILGRAICTSCAYYDLVLATDTALYLYANADNSIFTSFKITDSHPPVLSYEIDAMQLGSNYVDIGMTYYSEHKVSVWENMRREALLGAGEATSFRIPKNALLTSAKVDVTSTVQYEGQGNKPLTAEIDIGGDGQNVSTWTDQLKGLDFTQAKSPWTIDFTSELQSILTNCTADAGVCTVPITVSAEGAGGVVLDKLRIVYGANQPPFFLPIQDQLLNVGEQLTLLVHAVDPEGSQVNITDNSPLFNAEMLNKTTGRIVFNATPEHAGAIYTIGLTAKDPEGLTATASFKIIVVAQNRPPVITPILDQVGFENVTFHLFVLASDPDGDPITFADNTSLFEIGATGLIEFIPQRADVGEHYIMVSAADQYGLAAYEDFKLTIRRINNPPVLSPIPDLVAVPGQEFYYKVTATDPDGDPLAFTDNSTIFNISAGGIINFTATDANLGEHPTEISVSDGQYSDKEQFRLKVQSISYCVKDSDCVSGYCRHDWDAEKFCSANSTACVSNYETGAVKSYPSGSLFDTDTADKDGEGYRCSLGHWSEDPFSTKDTFSKIAFSHSGYDTSTQIKLPRGVTISDARLLTEAYSAMSIDVGVDGTEEYTSRYENLIAGSGGQFGSALAAAGDVNRDGYADILIGASHGNTAYLYFGSKTGATAKDSISLTKLSGFFGASVASVGDIDGNNLIDFIVGAPGNNSAYIYLTYPNLRYKDHEFRLSAQTGDFGAAVSGAGDVNSDNFKDFIVGAPAANKAYVYYGVYKSVSTQPAVNLTGPAGFGSALAAAGDINNDGYDDIAVSAPDSKKVFIYYGSSAGILADSYQELSGEGLFGSSVASAGDANGDGFSDLIIGDPFSNKAYIYYGNATMLAQPTILQKLSGFFGSTVFSAGDVNNDGYGDVIISAYQTEKLYVYFGSANGIDPSSEVIIDKATIGAFGEAISPGGDINYDGFDDIIFGFPLNNEVYVYYLNSEGVDLGTPIEIVDIKGALQANVDSCSQDVCTVPVKITSGFPRNVTVDSLRIVYSVPGETIVIEQNATAKLPEGAGCTSPESCLTGTCVICGSTGHCSVRNYLVGDGCCQAGEDGANSPADCCKTGDGVCTSNCQLFQDYDCLVAEEEEEVFQNEILLQFSSLPKDGIRSKVITKKYIDLTSFAIDVRNDLQDVSFRIKSYRALDEPFVKPEGIPDAPGLVYRYFSITPYDIGNADIDTIALTLKVAKDWIAANNIDESKITVYEYANSWVPLTTGYLTSDLNFAYYATSLESLSYFAISGGEPGITEAGKVPAEVDKGARLTLPIFSVPREANILEIFPVDVRVANIEGATLQDIKLELVAPDGWTVSEPQTFQTLSPGDFIDTRFKVASKVYEAQTPVSLTFLMTSGGETVLTKEVELQVNVPDFLVVPDPKILLEGKGQLRVYTIINSDRYEGEDLSIEMNLNDRGSTILTDVYRPQVTKGLTIKYQDYSLTTPLEDKDYKVKAVMYLRGIPVGSSETSVDLSNIVPAKVAISAPTTVLVGVFAGFAVLLLLAYGAMKRGYLDKLIASFGRLRELRKPIYS